MTKKKFEEKIKELNVVKKYYSKNHLKGFEYYVDEEKFAIFGCFSDVDKKYIVFYKDFEREKSKEIGEFDTEEEAYDVLLELIQGK